VRNNLSQVEEQARASGASFDDWKRESREAMWNTQVGNRSVFTDDATYQFLSRQHGLAGQRSGSIEQDMAFMKKHVAGSLALQSQHLRRDAINQGFAINAKGRGGFSQRENARAAYITQTIRRDFGSSPVQFQNQIREELDRLLRRPDGYNFESDAQVLVNKTRSQFNEHFRAIADFAAVAPGDRVRPEQRNLVEHMNIGHAQAIHTYLPGNLRDIQVAGPSHAEFVQQYVYDTRVMQRPVSEPSRRVLITAASEIAGQQYMSAEAARDFMRSQGYTQVSQAAPAARPTRRGRPVTPPRAGTPRSAAEQALIERLLATGMSLEEAQRRARASEDDRPRGDAVERSPIYMATYLAQLQRREQQ
jgi:hypothetical protein